MENNKILINLDKFIDNTKDIYNYSKELEKKLTEVYFWLFDTNQLSIQEILNLELYENDKWTSFCKDLAILKENIRKNDLINIK